MRIGYALAALAVFVIEVLIALYVRDAFVRPYLGDSLAVILVYLGLRAVLPVRVLPAVIAAFGIAVVIEISQYLQLVRALGLADSEVASTVLGTGFDWMDIVAYAGGAIATVLIERWRERP